MFMGCFFFACCFSLYRSCFCLLHVLREPNPPSTVNTYSFPIDFAPSHSAMLYCEHAIRYMCRASHVVSTCLPVRVRVRFSSTHDPLQRLSPSWYHEHECGAANARPFGSSNQAIHASCFKLVFAEHMTADRTSRT